jgi:hypothetical protein
VIRGEQHLPHLLNSYASIAEEGRTDSARRPEVGRVTALPILGGRHHRYVRVNFRQGQARPDHGQLPAEALREPI